MQCETCRRVRVGLRPHPKGRLIMLLHTRKGLIVLKLCSSRSSKTQDPKREHQ